MISSDCAGGTLAIYKIADVNLTDDTWVPSRFAEARRKGSTGRFNVVDNTDVAETIQ